MNQNNNHLHPNVNPPEPQKERGSILKHLLLALALLALSGSLLYAMVVTKPSAPIATKPGKFPTLTVKPKTVALTLAVSPNPCAVGDTVTCTINLAGIYDTNNDESITNDSVNLGGSLVGNDFVATYQATDSGVHTVTAYANGGQIGSANLEVVAVTDITVDPTPGVVNKFQAVIDPNDALATAFGNGHITWSGATANPNGAMDAKVPVGQAIGPITVTAYLGTSSATETYEIDFDDPVPTELVAGSSTNITASSTPSGRTIGWKVVSSDPGVKVSFANTNTVDGDANTINVDSASASGNVVIEAYDYQIGAACGTQTTIQIKIKKLVFSDQPARPKTDAPVNWSAKLQLVCESTWDSPNYTSLYAITYGFNIDTNGKVTLKNPVGSSQIKIDTFSVYDTGSGGAGGVTIQAHFIGSCNGYLRWVQTITTSDPKGGCAGPNQPYNDPCPPDDSLPYYWTDAEWTNNISNYP